ncbi:MAG: dihydrofolate reductase family protein [Thermoplasmata archaeon]|nr:dihydrofolate reductase family protein [Thermoplasmata archaeon]
MSPERGDRPPRPFVHANCAISVDGKLAFGGGARARLSGPEDLRRVQRLRSECDAILVGAGTVRLDDPSLRVHWELLGQPPGRDPLRVILDARGGLPAHARVLDGSRPTLVAGTVGSRHDYPAGVERFRAGSDQVDLTALLAHLSQRGVRRLLVEGGARVLASFLGSGLVDELTVFIAPMIIGDRSAPSMVDGLRCPDEGSALRLTLRELTSLDGGALLRLARLADDRPGAALNQNRSAGC